MTRRRRTAAARWPSELRGSSFARVLQRHATANAPETSVVRVDEHGRLAPANDQRRRGDTEDYGTCERHRRRVRSTMDHASAMRRSDRACRRLRAPRHVAPKGSGGGAAMPSVSASVANRRPRESVDARTVASASAITTRPRIARPPQRSEVLSRTVGTAPASVTRRRTLATPSERRSSRRAQRDEHDDRIRSRERARRHTLVARRRRDERRSKKRTGREYERHQADGVAVSSGRTPRARAERSPVRRDDEDEIPEPLETGSASIGARACATR